MWWIFAYPCQSSQKSYTYSFIVFSGLLAGKLRQDEDWANLGAEAQKENEARRAKELLVLFETYKCSKELHIVCLR